MIAPRAIKAVIDPVAPFFPPPPETLTGAARLLVSLRRTAASAVGKTSSPSCAPATPSPLLHPFIFLLLVRIFVTSSGVFFFVRSTPPSSTSFGRR